MQFQHQQIQGLEIVLDDEALAWRATRHPGVHWIDLHPGPGAHAEGKPRDSTVLIRMAPGSGYPRHRHLDVEEVLILRGGYRDEQGEHRAGAYLRYEKDSEHTPIALGDPARPTGPGNPSCILFAVARGGVLNLH
ncbi:MAG: cupin domain-containing protein [Planctomycetes bacterium]|nr:cupin domain-containing protein [Planctomycetota bacterium]